MRFPARLFAAALATLTGLGLLAVPAPASGAPDHLTKFVVPLQPSDLAPAIHKYRKYVRGRIHALVPAVHRLQSHLASGDVKGAKDAWLSARLIYLRIGQDNSAYGIFGDLGQSIDGTAAGHSGGTHSSSFTGFHRVEWDLWHRHNPAAARSDAAKLHAAVVRLSHVSLKKAVPVDVDGASGFILRSHEIIEDAVRDSLSGNDEYGSGTALAAVVADVEATREVLKLLAPLLKKRAPHLVAKAKRDLTRLEQVARTGKHHGHWTAIKALPREKRQSVNAAAGAADEQLAPIPGRLRIGNT